MFSERNISYSGYNNRVLNSKYNNLLLIKTKNNVIKLQEGFFIEVEDPKRLLAG